MQIHCKEKSRDFQNEVGQRQEEGTERKCPNRKECRVGLRPYFNQGPCKYDEQSLRDNNNHMATTMTARKSLEFPNGNVLDLFLVEHKVRVGNIQRVGHKRPAKSFDLVLPRH